MKPAPPVTRMVRFCRFKVLLLEATGFRLQVSGKAR
jgi:hypothetical protein